MENDMWLECCISIIISTRKIGKFMINEIHIDRVTSYKTPSKILPTNKISLIYGLNGAGKSTISNFLYDRLSVQYANCKIVEDSGSEILVYNQRFLTDYFHEEDSLKGIFTLSKENKLALEKIDRATKNFESLEGIKDKISDRLKNIQLQQDEEKTKTTENVWKIKTQYSGGDRVLEYCLEGLKRTENLFNHIKSIQLPSSKPIDTIEVLKKELSAVQGDNAFKIDAISKFEFSGAKVEQNIIFQKIIVGSQEGTVAEFINRVGNSDWVKTGLGYVTHEVEKDCYPCPFCQEDTITKNLLASIREVFNDSYETDLALLGDLKTQYNLASSEINIQEIDSLIVVDSDILQRWKAAAEEIKSVYRENTLLIENKLKSPSSPITIRQSIDAVVTINILIDEINALVEKHNEKLDNKKGTLDGIKKRFWNLMRWDYDQTLSAYTKTEERLIKEIATVNSELTINDLKLSEVRSEISFLRKETVNIEEAIENINSGLSEIGIVGFSIIKHSENLYRVARSGAEADAFHSLSEGEKTVISFLYFIELCKGQRTASATHRKKIVVIDDPISSLSHIYVFNIGQLIKKSFFSSTEYEQVFVLSHSLYFFYELTETNKDKRHQTQNLYRITKNSNGSSVVSMKYEEIQNDYQSYWAIIKDQSTPPALIANCMRNIIEYFFNFVQKKDFNNVFQTPELATDKFKTFYRYMNRESHSLGQNIFDIKEFDYEIFRDGLRLIFNECGYSEHYVAMMK